jgi:hypothetical protein
VVKGKDKKNLKSEKKKESQLRLLGSQAGVSAVKKKIGSVET